jgi:hypothetical protein
MSRPVTTQLIATLSLLLSPGLLAAATVESQGFEAQLLEDLGSDLLPSRFRESQVLRDLSLATPQPEEAKEDRLALVVQHMQTARSQLEQQGVDHQASSAQSQAIDNLEAMIAELTRRKSQCQGGASKPGSKPKSGPPKPGQGGTNPGAAASATTSQRGDLAANLAATAELVKDLWGHLPERQRQQILQPLSEEFLPQYATEIEEYFRALADPDRRPPESP